MRKTQSFVIQCGYKGSEDWTLARLVEEAQIARSVKNQYLRTELTLMQLVVASVISENSAKELKSALTKLE